MLPRTAFISAIGLLAVLAGPAAAQDGPDRIVLTNGTDLPGIEVIQETVKQVRYKIAGSAQTVESDTVVEIVYGNAPSSWSAAEGARRDGNFEQAVERYQAALGQGSQAPWIEVYATYALGLTYRAWAEMDPRRLEDAAQAFEQFERRFKNHRLLPHALFGAGDAAALLGQSDKADGLFDKLVTGDYGASWTAQGTFGKGLVALARNRGSEAGTAFDRVVSEARSVRGLEDIVGRAKAGKGLALVLQDRVTEAIGHLESLVNQAGLPGTAYALAYRALGDAYRKNGSDQDSTTKALYAYLRVVLLYGGSGPDAVAARKGAIACFRALGQEERAKDLER